VPTRVDELAQDKSIEDNMRNLGLLTRYRNLRSAASSPAVGALSELFVSRKVLESPILTRAAMLQLESLPAVDKTAVLKVADAFADPGFGDGIKVMAAANPTLGGETAIKTLIDAGMLGKIDRIGQSVTDSTRLTAITNSVTGVLTGSDPNKADQISAISSVVDKLGTTRLMASDTLKEAALTGLQSSKTDPTSLSSVSATLADPTFGAGISRIEAASPGLKDSQVVSSLVASNALAGLDQLGKVADAQSLKAVTDEVVSLARSTDPNKTTRIAEVINKRLKGLTP